MRVYPPMATTSTEEEALHGLIPRIVAAAAETAELPIQYWEFVPTIVERLLKLSDENLRKYIGYSSSADYYNIGLVKTGGYPRNLVLRLNIYPFVLEDVAYHTHRTDLSSLILAGSLNNKMFHENKFTESKTGGDHRLVKATDTPGVFEETEITGFLPPTRAISDLTHQPGGSYVVPVDEFHKIATVPKTVTLCLFHRGKTDFREPLVLKSLDATPETHQDIDSGNVMELIRESLSAVLQN